MVLISVIIPVFKVEAYLNRCVESVANQTYQNLEIILVDDGSSDTCPEICDAWAKKDSRVKIIHKENGGLSDARNVGMRVASGEFVGFVDSDDWIAPEMYEKLMAVMEKDRSDIAACAVKMVWEDGTPGQMLTVQTNCVLNREEAQQALLEESLLKQPVWYKLYKRETIQNIPFEKGKYHEDVFWSYQAVGHAEKVSVIDFVGYFYWQRSESIMGETYSLKRLDAVEAIIERQGYLKTHFSCLESLGRIHIYNTCLYNGQKAIAYLKGEDKEYAINYLKKSLERYPLTRDDLFFTKLTHRVWFILEKMNFQFCCLLRNHLRVGI